jgi:hypothetical protein
MELAIRILSKVKQVLDDKGNIFSHVRKIDQKKNLIHKYNHDYTQRERERENIFAIIALRGQEAGGSGKDNDRNGIISKYIVSG